MKASQSLFVVFGVPETDTSTGIDGRIATGATAKDGTWKLDNKSLFLFIFRPNTNKRHVARQEAWR